MLVKISKEEALKMLSDKKEQEKVFFKRRDSYDKVNGYKWVFGRTDGGFDFIKTEFYKED